MTTSIQLGNIFTDNTGTTRVSGGQSGFDIEGLVESLAEAKRLPAVQIEDKLAENTLRIDSYNQLRSLTNNFRDAANFLRNPPGVQNDSDNIFEYRAAAINSSIGGNGASYMSITAEPGTPIGEFAVTVDQIAERNVKTTETFAAADEDASIVGGGGPLNAGILTLGPNNVEITLEDGDTLNQVLAKVNAVSEESNVEASYIKVSDGNYRLSFKTTETGDAMNYEMIPSTVFTADGSGHIAIEAEHFNSANAATATSGTSSRNVVGVEWETFTDGSYSGGEGVTTPNIGQLTNTGQATEAPELNYNVQLDNAGTYYVWMNMQAPAAASDTVFFGLDGVPLTRVDNGNTAQGTDAGTTALAWSNDVAGDAAPIQFTIAPGDEGVHEFSLWMREDGANIDKFVITQDAGFVPTGAGPAENIPTNSNSSIFNIGFAIEQDAQDAQMTVDGTQITRTTNDFDDVIDGLTFNLTSETPVGEELQVKVEPDTELAKQGIINFVESYNAVKLYASEQTAIGDDGAPEDGAILAGDSTLRLILSRINNELSQQVKGIAGDDFSRLSDLGITFSDFPGDDETPFTRNILTLDEDKLDSALSTDYDALRDVFEFNSTSDNADFQVFERSNSLGVSDYSINVDTLTGTYTATYDLNGTITTVDLDSDTLSDGTLVFTGQAGTELAGMTMLFSNPTDTVINVSTTQGIADRLFNTLDGLLLEGEGAIDVVIQSMQDDEARYNSDIETIDQRVERFRQQLITQFSALEAAIAQSNTLLQSLDAQANARNQ